MKTLSKPRTPVRRKKTKVTVSLQPEIVSLIDSKVAASPGETRSGLVEQVLREWQSTDALRTLEQETAVYYDSLTEEEREEDIIWAGASEQAASKTWGHES